MGNRSRFPGEAVALKAVAWVTAGMSLPDSVSLEAFSLAELREAVGRLVGEVRRLRSDNAALQAGVDAQQATIMALRAENQALRDEVARLKGLPPLSFCFARCTFPPSAALGAAFACN